MPGVALGIAHRPSVSGARIFAKVLHFFSLEWTVLMLISAARGIIGITDASTSTASAVGATFAIGLLSLMWVVPVVGMELIALATGALAGKPDSRDAGGREWRIAGVIAAVPFGLIALALIVRALEHV